MTNQARKWEILHKEKISKTEQLVKVLLKNRGIISEGKRQEFLNPKDPMKITLNEVGIKEEEVNKAVERIEKAKKNNEHVIIYGDYDADGITGTAILWETLHSLGIFVLPHIPERFIEGYGLNLDSVEKLKKEDPKLTLIITVDHGITSGDKIPEIKKLGIDMVITDHHQKGTTVPKPSALIYTTILGGSAIAWFLAREVIKKLGTGTKFEVQERLSLAAIGTIADQLPLVGPNRAVVSHGLKELENTKRPGIMALFREARISEIGPYEVGYIIAPRINSMGRLRHGLESLRLLCTNDRVKAYQIAGEIGRVNRERQKIVDEVVAHALSHAATQVPNVIVLANEKYHEGVIGLAAAKLVEKFHRPAIVISVKGELAKASARSIPGFNIIDAIRKLDKYYIEGGGHPMAAGFSIKTKNIGTFTKKINKLVEKLLTDEILQRRLKIDCEIDFDLIDFDLIKEISLFEPVGIGNPEPVFVSNNVELLDARLVGRESKHIKLKIKQDEHIIDSIYFGGGEIYSKLSPGKKLEIVYGVENNVWNGNQALQLKIRDLRITT